MDFDVTIWFFGQKIDLAKRNVDNVLLRLDTFMLFISPHFSAIAVSFCKCLCSLSVQRKHPLVLPLFCFVMVNFLQESLGPMNK